MNGLPLDIILQRFQTPTPCRQSAVKPIATTPDERILAGADRPVASHLPKRQNLTYPLSTTVQYRSLER